MLRTISAHIRAPLRSLPQTLTYLPQPSFSSTPFTTHSPFKLPIDPSHSSSSTTPSFPSISTLSLSSPFSHSPLLQRHEVSRADDCNNRDPTSPPRLFVVQPRLRPQPFLQAKLDEALSLANSLEEQRDGFFDTELWDKELPPHVVVQNPAARSRHSDTYFGPGTVETVKCHLNAVESKGEVDAVFVNAILTGIQQRNLERKWGKPVLDRVGLIIEIFNAHAYTKEGKLQAELAALMYKRTRLVRVRGPDGRYTFGSTGEAEVVSARGRGSGGRGFISGAGETELQLQRRRILERRKQLLSEIQEVRRTRALQRAARKRHGGDNGQDMVTVAVVGYTNAGKSTLVSTLSNSDLYSDDRLFATVDPKLRSVILPSGRKVLFSDTVGFISDLPVQLVEAFHATLEEVVEADLLVHVLDSSAPNLDEHRETVLQVLKQIGVSDEKLQNMIEVWNKIDLQEEMGADDDEISSFSGVEEVNDVEEYKLSSGEPIDDCDDNSKEIVSELSLGGHEESIDDQQSDYSDGWLLSGDERETSNEKMGWEKTPNDQHTMLCEDWRKTEQNSHSQSQYGPHVKVSAVMGVGLQELLELIDAKLKSQNVVEKNIVDRKWRPPRTEDVGIAVEQ
ncbi:GTP-binding protein At3g49725, chloroplastic [Camellia sinensis]|uniref:GTP-binding protein At3g49725, chloroplastic n=1 Tax=Camellia sinensis TaxID=4442 RepID=UPI0010360A1B|nr:GTP-binding protein At3g49725, chloroplastic [Camellia sinensis]